MFANKKSLEKDFNELKDLIDKEREEIAESLNDLHTQNIKLFAARMRQLTKNMERLYGIVCTNCSQPLKTEITAITDHEKHDDSFDCAWQ